MINYYKHILTFFYFVDIIIEQRFKTKQWYIDL